MEKEGRLNLSKSPTDVFKGVDKRSRKVLLVECKLAASKVNRKLVEQFGRQAEYMTELLLVMKFAGYWWLPNQ